MIPKISDSGNRNLIFRVLQSRVPKISLNTGSRVCSVPGINSQLCESWRKKERNRGEGRMKIVRAFGGFLGSSLSLGWALWLARDVIRFISLGDIESLIISIKADRCRERAPVAFSRRKPLSALSICPLCATRSSRFNFFSFLRAVSSATTLLGL